MLLRLILAIPIVLMPNLLYLSVDSGVPGVNVATLLLLALVVALAFSRTDPALPSPDAQGMLTAPLLLWFAALAIGFLIARATMPIALMEDLVHFKNVVFYPLLYLIYRRCGQDLRSTRQLIYLTMAVAVAAGLDAVIQGLSSFDIGTYVEENRAAGPFGDKNAANRAGVFFAMFLPLPLAVALFVRGHIGWRITALVGSGVLAFAIMLTYSRQSYLIALVAIILLLMRRDVVFSIMLAVLAVPATALLPDSVTERVQVTERYDAVGAVKLDDSTESRFEIWAGAWDMWKEHPFGVGLNRFREHIGDYSQHADRDAHSIYVLTLAELGPLGLLALLWLLWRLLRLALAIRAAAPEADAEAQALGIGFVVAILAMALGNVYGSPLIEGLVMANFWILCGLVEHYVALHRQAGLPTAIPSPAEVNGRIGSRFPLAARVMPGRYRPARE